MDLKTISLPLGACLAFTLWAVNASTEYERRINAVEYSIQSIQKVQDTQFTQLADTLANMDITLRTLSERIITVEVKQDQ